MLEEKLGVEFGNFIDEKLCPLVGDIMYEDFGLDIAKLTELYEDIDVIVNGAATTNFFERFDVFLGRRSHNLIRTYMHADEIIGQNVMLILSDMMWLSTRMS